MRLNSQRILQLKDAPDISGPVVYWMSRDQRIDDNWALVHAQDLAVENNQPLRIVFCIVQDFLKAGLRHYEFMLKGLYSCSVRAEELNIPFDLIQGNPANAVPEYLSHMQACRLVMDFDPLKIKKKWQTDVLEQVNISVSMVDAHNIVPCWITSDKQEYAARTIRPKIHRRLDEFLDPFPSLTKMPQSSKHNYFDAEQIIKNLNLNKRIAPVKWLLPGPHEALNILDKFISDKLSGYDEHRNDPNRSALSNLSPYLHFGQICSQTVALKIREHGGGTLESRDSFLEELIVRKELSDNFCYYNSNYDNFEGLPEWGKKTLNKHLGDERPHLYSMDEFEQGLTHDPLWNAAQMEMVITGKMHGYMRMYWAKKILEWTRSPAQAIEWAITLNDRYELDGRDPNGYTGILWSVGGLHDRPWKERPVFGTVRYMSYNGCKRKFDVDGYIRQWTT